jgi:hypothetical protein
MLGALLMNSKANGYYFIEGDPSYWQYVQGRVISSSRKTIAHGRGVGYFRCKVQYKTDRGIRVARVIKSSKKCFCRKGAISFLNATVGMLPKFRDGRIIGKCARKVFVR